MSDDRVWIDLVNIRFSCGTGESIEFHFDDVIKRVSFDEAFFKQHGVKPANVKLALATFLSCLSGSELSSHAFRQDCIFLSCLSGSELVF